MGTREEKLNEVAVEVLPRTRRRFSAAEKHERPRDVTRELFTAPVLRLVRG